MKIRTSFFILNILVSSSVIANDPLNSDWIDKKVSPKDDFFTFANGDWIKNNPIPKDHSGWGAHSIVIEDNLKKVHDILVKASQDKNAKPGSNEQKVGDFYYSGMDVKSINKLGVQPLQNEFDKINSISSIEDLQKVIAHLHSLGVQVLFSFSSSQDFEDSTKVIGAASQSGGITLPSRDYYLKSDKKFAVVREKYLQYITNMFELLGDNNKIAQGKSKVIMRLEKDLAKASLSSIEMRDPSAVYHIMDISQLDKLTPKFNWNQYFDGIDLPNIKSINMGMPKYFEAVNKAFTKYSLSDWKTYLTWQLLHSVAPYISEPFERQNFKMAQVLSGVETMPPRWKRVAGTEDALIGFAVGQLFVEKYFSASAKQEVIDMIKNIRKVLKLDLKELSWMTEKTKQAAIKKLDIIEDRVGYPDKWRDYSSLKIDRGPYVLNILRSSTFLLKRDLNKIGKPVDRTEWEMTPQTVNAYYHQTLNSINIPMGILSSPYFDPKASAAINYGGIGVVIGHEITHGFDDQGAKFDSSGNLSNWWDKKDIENFHAATQCIVDQYSKYKFENTPLKGKLVVGEATADLGGIILAYTAYKHSPEYKTAKSINGYTPDQQFFISFAHIWASHLRSERALNLITVDPHPLAKYRVNGTLANMPDFAKAFNVPPQSQMVNKKRCVIW